eukprot:1330421-Rhodomonas_salina.1
MTLRYRKEPPASCFRLSRRGGGAGVLAAAGAADGDGVGEPLPEQDQADEGRDGDDEEARRRGPPRQGASGPLDAVFVSALALSASVSLAQAEACFLPHSASWHLSVRCPLSASAISDPRLSFPLLFTCPL